MCTRTKGRTYGVPFLSENEGHVLFALPCGRVRKSQEGSKIMVTVGSAGQQAPSPKLGTLPSAAAYFEPGQLDAQETLW